MHPDHKSSNLLPDALQLQPQSTSGALGSREGRRGRDFLFWGVAEKRWGSQLKNKGWEGAG